MHFKKVPDSVFAMLYFFLDCAFGHSSSVFILHLTDNGDESQHVAK